MNAFEMPSLRSRNDRLRTKLNETEDRLATVVNKCEYLDEQILAKENFYATREKELLECHNREVIDRKFCSRLSLIFCCA